MLNNIKVGDSMNLKEACEFFLEDFPAVKVVFQENPTGYAEVHTKDSMKGKVWDSIAHRKMVEFGTCEDQALCKIRRIPYVIAEGDIPEYVDLEDAKKMATLGFEKYHEANKAV